MTAAFAVGLAFSGDARRTGAFFAGFFLIVLVFLTVVVFLRAAALVTGVFLRFALVTDRGCRLGFVSSPW